MISPQNRKYLGDCRCPSAPWCELDAPFPDEIFLTPYPALWLSSLNDDDDEDPLYHRKQRTSWKQISEAECHKQPTGGDIWGYQLPRNPPSYWTNEGWSERTRQSWSNHHQPPRVRWTKARNGAVNNQNWSEVWVTYLSSSISDILWGDLHHSLLNSNWWSTWLGFLDTTSKEDRTNGLERLGWCL